MNKTVFSAGLALVGAIGSLSGRAADSQILAPKVCDVSASLRGFYDDNYNISGGRGSYGTELVPSISFNVPLQQTDVGLRYIYGLYYYNDRDSLGLNPFDQTHQVNIWLDHAFNTRWKLTASDTVAVGQEPELINNPNLPSAQVFRLNGNNVGNHANLTLSTEWTRQFSTSLNYGNDFYSYDNSGATLIDILPGGKGPSYAGQLNRIEQHIDLDLQWHFQPETMGFVGYQFSWVNFTGNELISYSEFPDPIKPLIKDVIFHHSADRDSRTHYGYVGVQHQFTPNLAGTVRGGAAYTDNYNDPNYPSTSVSPYVDFNSTYTYSPGSYLQVGFTQDNNATDVVKADTTGHLTQYQESSVIYADINHRLTPKLVGTIIARDQISAFQYGAYSSSADTDYSLGLNFDYQINHHFSVDVGYNYDQLVSDIPGRGFERNRFYFGLTATY